VPKQNKKGKLEELYDNKNKIVFADKLNTHIHYTHSSQFLKSQAWKSTMKLVLLHSTGH